MRALLTAAVLAAVVTAIVLLATEPPSRPGQPSARTRAERRAEKMLANLDRSIREKRAGTLRGLLTPGFVHTRQDGVREDRDAFVRAALSSDEAVPEHTLEAVTATRRMIVATGSVAWPESLESRGLKTRGRGVFTAVIARRGEDWEIAAIHSSRAVP